MARGTGGTRRHSLSQRRSFRRHPVTTVAETQQQPPVRFEPTTCGPYNRGRPDGTAREQLTYEKRVPQRVVVLRKQLLVAEAAVVVAAWRFTRVRSKCRPHHGRGGAVAPVVQPNGKEWNLPPSGGEPLPPGVGVDDGGHLPPRNQPLASPQVVRGRRPPRPAAVASGPLSLPARSTAGDQSRCARRSGQDVVDGRTVILGASGVRRWDARKVRVFDQASTNRGRFAARCGGTPGSVKGRWMQQRAAPLESVCAEPQAPTGLADSQNTEDSKIVPRLTRKHPRASCACHYAAEDSNL